jgi:hypothetical protein
MMIHITFSLFADVMQWGTIPLIGVLGFWEQHLTLTDTDRKLVQMVLMVILFVWAYLWNSLGERDRLAHSTSQIANHPKIHQIELGSSDQVNYIHLPSNEDGHLPTKSNVSVETMERYHVSNH